MKKAERASSVVEANPVRIPPEETRLSSLKPYAISLPAALIGVVFVAVAARRWSSSDLLSWTLLALGIADLAVALAVVSFWKRVWRGPGYYLVSDLFQSERIAVQDVCLRVPGRGLFCNCIHIHFNRPTRFGWHISYVPLAAREDSPGSALIRSQPTQGSWPERSIVTPE